MPTRPAHPRALLLIPAGLTLLAGLDGALLLLGLTAPVSSERWEQVHGPLMVLGFVGTVIALERAVALRRLWGYLAPTLLGIGALALLAPIPLRTGQAVLLLGTIALLLVYRAIWRRGPALPLAVEILGAASATGAAALWLAGVAVPFLAPWLVGFLVLTILGERLELSVVGLTTTAQPPRAQVLATALGGLWLLAAATALVLPTVGYLLLGLTLLTLVAVVGTADVARRTIRTTGLTRFMAAAMLAGYAWLAVAGATWLVAGPLWQGPGYDAVLHAVFLGFVISMIIAHAPVILPAVIRRPLPYRPVLWVPLVLLHVSLLTRVLLGDAWGVPAAVAASGVANIVALLLFVVLAAGSVVLGAPPTRPRAAEPAPAAPALTLGTAR